MKKTALILAVILFVLLIAVSLGKKTPPASQEGDVKGVVNQSSLDANKVPYDLVKDGYFKGPEQAKITLVEFSDYQCPACAQMSQVVDDLVKAYPNDLKVVYRHFPLSFHKYARAAAYAAESAGQQGKYWPMNDLIFANQAKLSETIFVELAKELNLNMEQFSKDFASEEIKKKIDRDTEEAYALQIDGTPTFYLNNQKYLGEYTLYGFKIEIDKILTQ